MTLTTDFGHSDPFVGVMKGVLLRECPDAPIVDLCHGIAPQDRKTAAYWVGRCHAWFPAGTVHVVVVDPTVGTERRIVVVRAHGHTFVLPDNGIVGADLSSADDFVARTLDAARLGLPEPSQTFHGRDVFAPVAARLAKGDLQLDDVGPVVGDLSPAVLGEPTFEERGGRSILRGEVATMDRFGNVITNLPVDRIPMASGPRVSILQHTLSMAGTYARVEAGELLALGNSFGTVEIAVRDGSAMERLGLDRRAVDGRLPVVVDWDTGLPPIQVAK